MVDVVPGAGQASGLLGKKVRLRDKKADDAWQDFLWRQDAELAELDATVPLDESFDEYRSGYVWELGHPAHQRHRYAIETLGGRHIGNIAYFDLNEKTKEVQMGIMVGDRDYWGRGYGTEAIQLLLEHLFLEVGVDRVHLRTLVWNLRAQASFKKCGFSESGKLSEGQHDFILMKVTKERWQEMRRTKGWALMGPAHKAPRN